MRMFTIAFAAAVGLMTAAVTDASAAGPGAAAVPQAQPGAVQLAQYYYPYYRNYPYWGYPYYRHHRPHWRPYYDYRWRYSQAEELNRQELRNLGVAP